MFPWSAVFSQEPKVPGQRTAEELVTNTLMLELGAMVKRTERIRLERMTEGRRRSSSSTADYSWLANTPAPQPYELTPNDLLELQELCAKIPPAQCGPLIVRWGRRIGRHSQIRERERCVKKTSTCRKIQSTKRRRAKDNRRDWKRKTGRKEHSMKKKMRREL